MGGLNTICVDEGYVEIDNEINCKKAIESKGLDYGGVQNKSYNPRGCTSDGAMVYNRHPVGKRHKQSRPLCITPGNLSYL